MAQAGVVAWPPGTALRPGVERRHSVIPGRQWPAILVAEVHSPRVFEEDVEIRSRRARWIDGLLGQMNGAVGVGEGARLLAPRRGGQHDVGEFGGFGAEDVL